MPIGDGTCGISGCGGGAGGTGYAVGAGGTGCAYACAPAAQGDAENAGSLPDGNPAEAAGAGTGGA
jgi:hypothetical protein